MLAFENNNNNNEIIVIIIIIIIIIAYSTFIINKMILIKHLHKVQMKLLKKNIEINCHTNN